VNYVQIHIYGSVRILRRTNVLRSDDDHWLAAGRTYCLLPLSSCTLPDDLQEYIGLIKEHVVSGAINHVKVAFANDIAH
jgi:hypothetical protein